MSNHDHSHEPEHKHDHDHSHGPGHSHDYRGVNKSRLRWAIIITAVTMVVEVVGGLVSGSLALISDAGHMFTHLFALGVSYLAVSWAGRPGHSLKSFGYYRGEILAALINGLTVLAVVAFIVYEAIEGIVNPQEIKTTEMMIIAGLGLVVNVVTAMLLMGAGKDDLNIKSAIVHLLGDLASSVAIIIGGVVMIFTDFWLLDPILSLMIAVVILIWSWGLIKESVHILLQGTPNDVELPKLREELAGYPCVNGVDDLHVWCLTSKMHVLTTRLRVAGTMTVQETTNLRRDILHDVKENHNIVHATVELIPDDAAAALHCAFCEHSAKTPE